MQSPKSLLAFGVGAVVAASTIAASPVAAEPGLLRRQPSPSDGAATPATATAGDEASSEIAQDPSEQRLDRLQQQNEIRQQLNQAEFQTPGSESTGSNSLQLEQSVQQQINLQELHDLRPEVGTTPSHSLDRLQFEQRVRQQLQQPNSPQSKVTIAQGNGVAQTEDESRTEASVDAGPVSPPVAETPAEDVAPPTSTQVEATAGTATPAADVEEQANTAIDTETAVTEAAITPAEPEPNAEVENPTETAVETPVEPTKARTRAAQQRSNPYARANRRSRSVEIGQNPTETVAPTPAAIAESSVEAQPESPAEGQPESVAQDTPTTAPEVAAEIPESAETVDTLGSEPPATPPEAIPEIVAEEKPTAETAQAGESEAETEETEATEDPEEETEASEESEERDRPAAASEKPSRTAEQAEDRIDEQNRDYPDDAEAPAPEYLDPDANPLSFPTQPEEVEWVGTQPITLQQAVQLAIRNNPVLQQERFQLERAQAALREAEASNYPTLDANATFTQRGQENFQEERQQLAPTNNPQQPLTTVTVPSETIYTDSTALGANLELSYPIYTSGRRSSLIQAAQGQVRLQQLELERQTEDLILNTTQDYYDLQQASAQVNIFTANLTESEQSLRDAQALERAGVGTRFDVLQAEVDVANARQELTQQLSQLEIARRQLAQRLSLAESLNVEAGDVIEVAGVWELSLPETLVQAYKNRAELEQQLIQREIAQNNRRAALAQLGPQFFFNGSFGVTNDLDRDPGFLYNYQLGLTASLSLYDGGEARAQANQQESNISIAESEFQNVRDQIRFQVEQAYSQLDSNFANIQTTALAVEQAAEALRLARLRFQAGVGTQTDVLRQQTALAQAQVNNLRAILDYNRAIASLQRQVSNYSEGFLNEQP